jgi:hypothetical protein
LHLDDLGRAADVPRGRALFRARLGDEVGEAEEVVRGAHVGQHAAVALLEDVERQRHAGEVYERQREDRQLPHAAHIVEGFRHKSREPQTVNRKP